MGANGFRFIPKIKARNPKGQGFHDEQEMFLTVSEAVTVTGVFECRKHKQFVCPLFSYLLSFLGIDLSVLLCRAGAQVGAKPLLCPPLT